MSNNYIVNTALLLALAIIVAACRDKMPAKVHARHDEPLADSSLATLTQRVNTQVIAAIPVVQPRKGTRTYPMELNGVIAYDTRNQTSLASRVPGRIERLLIKYNYQPVRKGQLLMEVYSPDLAAAQRELLYVARDGDATGLLTKAKERLQLLGMTAAQVEQVLHTGQVLYRVPVYSHSNGFILEQAAAAAAAPVPAVPAAGGNGMNSMGGASPAAAATLAAPAAPPLLLREGQYVNAGQPVFTIYQANSLVAEFSLTPQQASHVRKGQSLSFSPIADKSQPMTGTIGLIEPVFRNGQNFTIARVYLDKNQYRPGQLLTASFPVAYKDGWWLPEAAVGRLGNQAIVFKKEKEAFVPTEISIMATAGGMVQVATDITGWSVASQAAYLVDSEGFIKTSKNAQQ